MKQLKQQMLEDPRHIETVTMHYVSLPVEKAHSGHPTGGGVAGFAQRINEKVAAKLAEVVADGITEIKQVHVHTLYIQYIIHRSISLLCINNVSAPGS